MAHHLQSLKTLFPWVRQPLIVSAPMRVFASPALATAVYHAGGIGFIGPGAKPADLDGTLNEAHQLLLQRSPNSDTALTEQDLSRRMPLGIGIQTFDADLKVATTGIVKYRPAIVWLFAPRDGQKELDAWTAAIRDAAPGTQIWIQVGSVADAVLAANSASPPDALVIQGIDAGGHGLRKGAGVVSLVPEALDALKGTDIPLFAAGGIADGRGVAAALTLGAVGAVMGTRFLAAEEAKVAKGYRDDVLRLSDGGQTTVRTSLYDELAGRTDWPQLFDGRNIVNRSVEDQEAGVAFEENKKKFQEAQKKGDAGWGSEGRLTAYMGTGVGLIKELLPAGVIVERARSEAKDALANAKALL